MKLDMQSKAFLDAMNDLNLPPLETIPLEVIRARKSLFGYESMAPYKET